MAMFGGSKPGKPLLTQANFLRHRLYPKIRNVFAFGPRGQKKMTAVDASLDIEHDARRQLPRLKRSLEEDEAEDRLDRLAAAGMITEVEAEKIEDIIAEDLHPGSKG